MGRNDTSFILQEKQISSPEPARFISECSGDYLLIEEKCDWFQSRRYPFYFPAIFLLVSAGFVGLKPKCTITL